MVIVRPSRGSQSVDALLNALSPYDVAQAVRAYVRGLSPVRVHELVTGSLSGMDADERAQLALAFGASKVPRGDTPFDEPKTRDEELLSLVAEAGDSAPEKYANFLLQNVRALHALDRSIIDEMLGPVVLRSPAAARFSSFKPRRAARVPLGLTAVWLSSALIYAASLGIALWITHGILPAQLAPTIASAKSATPEAVATAAATAAPVRRVAVRTPQRPSHRLASKPVIRHHVPAVVAARPRVVQRAQVRHERRVAQNIRPRVRGSAAPPTLVQRARSTVATYLEWSLHRSRIRIVGSSARGDGSAKVDVEIVGPDGRYFGIYTVAFNGPATRITNKTVIPVSGPGRIP